MNALFIPIRSGTLLIPSGTAHDPDRRHLHVICTDPDAQHQVLLVSITTWTNDLCDATCVLNPGCHEFIRKKSWAFYRKPRIETTSTLINGVKENIFIPKECLAASDFQRLCAGILTSPTTPRKTKAYYAATQTKPPT